MIKNVLPSLRQGGGPQRICSRQKSIRSGTARDSFSQTPHTRGKDPTRWRCGRRSRITPAHAGKSASNHLAFHHLRDHPRTCGEKVKPVVYFSICAGSPPRMRGKGSMSHCVASLNGITPAYAGKSTEQAETACNNQDHPRVCGEKYQDCTRIHHAQGSPPHMRGKEGAVLVQLCKDGITPAHAGKSAAYLRAVWVPKGSPPRGRGKADGSGAAWTNSRITPACAGTSRSA